MNQEKFVTNRSVIPGLNLNPVVSCYSLDSCFRRNDEREDTDYYEIIDKWRRRDLVIVGLPEFHATGASPRSYPHAR
jgi:hypothetical protein